MYKSVWCCSIKMKYIVLLLSFLFLNTNSNAENTIYRYRRNTDHYEQNPFLNNLTAIKKDDLYAHNPFLQNSLTVNTTKKDIAYHNNPFLNGNIKLESTETENKTVETPVEFNIDIRINVDDDEGVGNPPYKDICGKPVIKPLLGSGKTFEKGEYPWIGALHNTESNEDQLSKFRCGATLITDKHVVTAAHCVKQYKDMPRKIIILFGKSNITTGSYRIDIKEGIVDAKKIYIHPNYEGPGEGDIAVVLLSKTVKFSNYIRPLCLWQNNSTSVDNITDSVGYIAGWGYNEKGEGNLESGTVTDMTIISKDECLQSNEQFHSLITDNNFCAGHKSKTGPCKGDSGSSLALQLNDIWYLRGVVSVVTGEGTSECNFNDYVILVDVAMYTEWLNEIIDTDG